VPFLTKLATILITGGPSALAERDGELARDARLIMERLGPTYIKAGQMMSVRPDVVGPRAMAELTKLQDAVPRFDTATAFALIEEELGVPLASVFREITPEPVAAASLAQVYRAKLASNGQEVAVKVQRPGIRSVVSKDLYVLRRAAEVYQGLMDRLAPSQRTDYVALLNEWAIGFFTELDFSNEARNAQRMRDSLAAAGITGVYVPLVFFEHSTRRVLVTEWVDGVKLTDCSPEEIKELIAVGQEAFLTQLLTLGFFHADPHPGNLLALRDTSKGYKLALLDFGLMARLEQSDMDALVNSVVHLANKDWAGLIDDFVALKILPPDTPRAKVEPLMGRVLGPYVSSGGGLKTALDSYGGARGVQSLTQDILTALSEVPFSIPPYFALLARAVAVLEGIALQGTPDYRIVMASFPFVSRKLLSDDAPELQRALSEILYAPAGSGVKPELRGQRLMVLLSAALGATAETGAFLDLDSVPEEGLPPADALRLLLSPSAASLRDGLLFAELTSACELLGRQALRRALRPLVTAAEALSRPPLPFLPPSPPPRVPVFLPGRVQPAAWVSPEAFVDACARRLTPNEELFAQSLGDAASALLGVDAQQLALGWSPLVLQPGPLGMPLPTLSALPKGVSADAAAAAVLLAARAARELRLPGADGDQARAATEALQGAVRGAAKPTSAPASLAHDAPAQLAHALAELQPQEATVLRAMMERLRDTLTLRLTARLEALAASA